MKNMSDSDYRFWYFDLGKDMQLAYFTLYKFCENIDSVTIEEIKNLYNAINTNLK
jgi:hypothetical protein